MGRKKTLSKIPVFHTHEVKINAVKEIKTLIATGLTSNQARTKIADKLDVHRTTIENWMKSYGKATVTTVSGQKTNHIISTKKSFSMHNVTFNTDLGYIKLSLDDIRSVAEFAKINSLT
jgi:uncharacterized protein YoaH (UPF0181 family)|tara:strand:+ start:216 stop:572 length:357 start_codon:yes stop_codon:yes gene_type:complete